MADQVLLTGISGFIARHVALALLRRGFAVRGTVRSADKAASVVQSLERAGADVSRLSFAVADLTADAGWRAAAEACRYVLHVASPFPRKQPKERDALIAPALGGTTRVIEAALAAGAERIVLTSSIVAMMYRAARPPLFRFGEADWTDTDWPHATAYTLSKTLAERAAWDLVSARGAREKLAVVNPGFVLGPALDADIGTSLGLIRTLLDGAYPAVPKLNLVTVDVRDLAEVHVAAMLHDAAGGRRLLAAGDTLSLAEMAASLRGALGRDARRVPRFALPDAMVRLVARLDPSVRTILPDLGVKPVADSAYVTALTGVPFRPSREAVIAAGRSLADLRLTRDSARA